LSFGINEYILIVTKESGNKLDTSAGELAGELANFIICSQVQLGKYHTVLVPTCYLDLFLKTVA